MSRIISYIHGQVLMDVPADYTEYQPWSLCSQGGCPTVIFVEELRVL